MENLNSLRVFVCVAEARSFTEAAKRLGLTGSAISKAVTRLEKELGVRLLQRTTRSVGLTDDGKSFFEHCQQILMDVEHAENMLSKSTSTAYGRLRLHMPVGFGRRVIMPALPVLLDRHPNLILNVELSDRNVDMAYEGIDAAVYIGEPADARLIARKLCNLRFVTCASPEYLARNGEPGTPDDLDHHHCLAYVLLHSGRYREWQFQKDGKVFSKTVSGRLNVNNAETLLEAAMAGLGIAMISNFIAADAIRSGKLRRILTDYTPIGPQVSVIYLPNRNLSPKVRAFVDFLQGLLPSNPDWDKITLP
ncbi:LysR family transcriptional regulator [Pollutimonas bauzanensis]|uniref:DNA-binding transcriptional regulator, LysR family n=1 Tax=Pollutimonas bauzanensis TaxID=658167 RepID=A0A1M5SHS0_9BURK|nr:LysR family transcriptional regulator [Pollutimonas bauzanensis]SHH38039.1 DNA-binding transcriptional regulator, LysR family [Pollutimonas bauzanensis]